VGNGQEAVDAVKQENFHIILMDCMMPVISGNAKGITGYVIK
jgi:CheY-like chemotaxis protein